MYFLQLLNSRQIASTLMPFIRSDAWWIRIFDFPRIRLERVGPEVRFLIEDDVPSIRAAVKLRAGIEIELHCLHPKPLVPQENAQSTERDAELMVVAKKPKEKSCRSS